MMRRLAVLCLLALAGCASAPPAERPAASGQAPFALNGRIAVKYDGRHSSSGFHWQHAQTSDDILLLAPLGVTVAHIHQDASGAILQKSHSLYRAPNSDILTLRTLGWQLPLAGLPYWVMARPAPGGKAQVARGPNGQVQHLSQDGWEIDYTAYGDKSAGSLPTRLTLRRADLEIRLLIDTWKFPPKP